MSPCYFFMCLMLAPAPGFTPDGAGGFVPITNSRVMPDGSLRPYDPIFDGGYLGAPTAVLIEPPGPPPPDFWVAPVVPAPFR